MKLYIMALALNIFMGDITTLDDGSLLILGSIIRDSQPYAIDLYRKSLKLIGNSSINILLHNPISPQEYKFSH